MIKTKSVILYFFVFSTLLSGNVFGQQSKLYSFVDSIYGILIESQKNFEKGIAYLNMMNEEVECEKAIEIYDFSIPLLDSSYKMILQIDTIREILKCKDISVNDSLIRHKFNNKSTGDLEVDYAIILDNLERFIIRCKEISDNLKELLNASKGQSAWGISCNPHKLKYDDYQWIEFVMDSYLGMSESMEIYLKKIRICNE